MGQSGAELRPFAAAMLLAATAAMAGCARDLLASGGEEGPRFAEVSCMRTNPKDAPPVAWLRTGTPTEQPVMDAWCSAVGPAFLSAPDDSADRGLPSDSLVVVSWNIHVGGGDLVRFVSDLRAGALTGGAPVASFVLLLQEAHRGGADVPTEAQRGAFPKRIHVSPPSGDRLDILETANRLGLHVLYAPSMRNGGPGGPEGPEGEGAEDRGNAILSTMPLANPEAIELPYEVQRRVAVAGTIAGVGSAGTPWKLRVVSAHLDNRSTLKRFWSSLGSGRARQARALADAISAEHAVVGADLNSWGAGFMESAVPLLLGRFPGTPPGPTGTYKAAGILPRTLDHLMFRLPTGCEAQLVRAQSQYGSDHYPLISVVRIPA